MEETTVTTVSGKGKVYVPPRIDEDLYQAKVPPLSDLIKQSNFLLINPNWILEYKTFILIDTKQNSVGINDQNLVSLPDDLTPKSCNGRFYKINASWFIFPHQQNYSHYFRTRFCGMVSPVVWGST